MVASSLALLLQIRVRGPGDRRGGGKEGRLAPARPATPSRGCAARVAGPECTNVLEDTGAPGPAPTARGGLGAPARRADFSPGELGHETEFWKVHIDPAQIDQILANLAVNARDAIDGVGK